MTVTVYVRDPDLNRVGQLDDFKQVTAEPKYNDVGTWTLTLDRNIPAVADLVRPGFGMQLVVDGVQVISGPVRSRKVERQQGERSVTIGGFSDDVWLNRRIAQMQPGTAAPPYSAQEFDVRTGVCSTVLRQYANVNLGPGAIAPRQLPGLVISSDPLVGSSVDGRARLQPLIELLRELALSGGDLGFRVVQVGTGLEFQTYLPRDLSQSVKFSEQLGNLGDYSFEASAPEATYVYVGGDGEGTARTFSEGADGDAQSEWGRIETFRDRRDTTDTDEMQQSITEELAEKAGPVSLTIAPFDTPQQRYGIDYGLGDRVTVTIEGEPIVEQIRGVSLSYDANGPLTVTSQIGTPGQQDVFRLFKAIRDLRYRVTNMERR